MLRFIILFLIFIIFPQPVYSENSTLKINDSYFNVELVITADEQAKGLMFRKQLGNNEGMLFVFANNRKVFMWMKNTLIPLDILFINYQGVITKIVKSTKPLSLDLIASETPVKAVLEVNAGISDNLDIKVGDNIIHPIFRD